LVLDENPAVQLADKKADELVATVQLFVLKIVAEKVWEFYVDEFLEKVTD
jgi:hypothetical protein